MCVCVCVCVCVCHPSPPALIFFPLLLGVMPGAAGWDVIRPQKDALAVFGKELYVHTLHVLCQRKEVGTGPQSLRPLLRNVAKHPKEEQVQKRKTRRKRVIRKMKQSARKRKMLRVRNGTYRSKEEARRWA